MDLRTLKGITMFSVSGLPRMASQMQRNLCDHHRCQHQHGQRPAVPCAPGMFHLVLDVSESLSLHYFFGFFFDNAIQCCEARFNLQHFLLVWYTSILGKSPHSRVTTL